MSTQFLTNLADSTSFPYFSLVIVLALVTGWLPATGRTLLLVLTTLVLYSVQGPTAIASLALCTATCVLAVKKLQGLECENKRRRLYLMALGIVLLPLLGYKYVAAGVHALDPQFSAPHIPPGVSFYTFQAVAMLTEVYWGTLTVTSMDALGFLLFFPHLLAGPLSDPKVFLKKLRTGSNTLSLSEMQICFARIFFGLFKKFVIADNLGEYVYQGFTAAHLYPGITVVFTIALYYVQVYADFSGYTDVAIGTAGLLRVPLPENFQSPYLSVSVTEFWRRWHITLGWWCTRYIFMPLNFRWRESSLGQYAATAVTFIIIGVWHGAGWNFLIYGLVHAAAVCFDMVLDQHFQPPSQGWSGRVVRALRILGCYLFVAFSLVLFRSETLAEALRIFSLTLRLQGGFHIFDQAIFATVVLSIAFMVVAEQLLPAYHKGPKPRWRSDLWWSRLAPLFVILTMLCGVLSGSSFVYFRF